MYILRISKDVKKFSGLTLLQTFIKCLVKFDGIIVCLHTPINALGWVKVWGNHRFQQH